MAEDFSRRVDGVREPDPTLGRHPLGRDPEQLSSGTSGELEIPEDLLEQQAAPEVKPPRRQRVVLTDPRQRAGGLRARVELEEQTSWGEMLIRDLVKAQAKTGIALFGLTLVILGALPLAFYLAPSFGGLTVIGVPLPWVLLGVFPFPLLFVVGLWYNRLAERNERDFVDMIES
jgi:hypothetical protein